MLKFWGRKAYVKRLEVDLQDMTESRDGYMRAYNELNASVLREKKLYERFCRSQANYGKLKGILENIYGHSVVEVQDA